LKKIAYSRNAVRGLQGERYLKLTTKRNHRQISADGEFHSRTVISDITISSGLISPPGTTAGSDRDADHQSRQCLRFSTKNLERDERFIPHFRTLKEKQDQVCCHRRFSSDCTSSITGSQSPSFSCRNRRAVGYQGLSVRSSNQRQSGIFEIRIQTGTPREPAR